MIITCGARCSSETDQHVTVEINAISFLELERVDLECLERRVLARMNSAIVNIKVRAPKLRQRYRLCVNNDKISLFSRANCIRKLPGHLRDGGWGWGWLWGVGWGDRTPCILPLRFAPESLSNFEVIPTLQ